VASVDATHIAPVPVADEEVLGLALAMLVIVAFAVVLFPVTLLVIVGVRVADYVPRTARRVVRRVRRWWTR
jgi:hypothetical protein